MHHKSLVFSIAGLVSALSISTSVTAQNSVLPNSPPMNIKVNCRNPQTQFDMNLCAAQSAKAADRQLNQTYQKAITKFKGTPQEKQLVDAQLIWIKFRDAECAFSRDRFKGGSIAPMVYSSCTDRLSQQRAKELEVYLTEGNL